MQELDNEFFEIYKRLDRLCSDIYGCRNGVSRYIEDMERVYYQGRLVVPAWDQFYKTLKHLRWVQNQIAHDSGQFQICKECDAQDANDFYHAIMSGRDPLTMLRKYHESRTTAKNPMCREEPATIPTASNRSDVSRPTRRRISFLAAAVLLLAGAATIIIPIIIVWLFAHFLR